FEDLVHAEDGLGRFLHFGHECAAEFLEAAYRSRPYQYSAEVAHAHAIIEVREIAASKSSVNAATIRPRAVDVWVVQTVPSNQIHGGRNVNVLLIGRLVQPESDQLLKRGSWLNGHFQDDCFFAGVRRHQLVELDVGWQGPQTQALEIVRRQQRRFAVHQDLP